MASAELVYSDPFGTGNRPYLALQLTGLNGQTGSVTGLVDSGADCTQLPIGYASLMGFTGGDLRQIDVGTAGAVTQAFEATVPCAAFVIGLQAVVFDLMPIFSPASSYVLWGRAATSCRYSMSPSARSAKHSLSTGDEWPIATNSTGAASLHPPAHEDGALRLSVGHVSWSDIPCSPIRPCYLADLPHSVRRSAVIAVGAHHLSKNAEPSFKVR